MDGVVHLITGHIQLSQFLRVFLPTLNKIKITIFISLMWALLPKDLANQNRVLFDPYIHTNLSHVKSPRTLHEHERYDC